MPCSFYTAEEINQMQNNSLERQLKEQKNQLDIATRILCSVLTNIDESQLENIFSSVDGSKDWWHMHKEMDEKRLKDHYKSALCKLSDDEIEAIHHFIRKETR